MLENCHTLCSLHRLWSFAGVLVFQQQLRLVKLRRGAAASQGDFSLSCFEDLNLDLNAVPPETSIMESHQIVFQHGSDFCVSCNKFAAISCDKNAFHLILNLSSSHHLHNACHMFV